MTGHPMLPAMPVEKLFPPDRPAEITRLLSTFGGGERDRDGKLMLPRPLTPPERVMLQKRRDVLFKNFMQSSPRDHSRVKALVAMMRLGFSSKASTEDEEDVINGQYAYALANIPAWAVERACMRFASANVTAADVGVKVLDLTWGPSTAMIAHLARSISQPVHKEARAIADLIAGVPAPRTEAPEDRARNAEAISKMTAETVAQLSMDSIEREADDRRRSDAMRERAAAQLEMRRQEYRDAGLEPPTGTTFASLPMTLKLGWSIQDSPSGGRILVAPRQAPGPGRRPTLDNEMGS